MVSDFFFLPPLLIFWPGGVSFLCPKTPPAVSNTDTFFASSFGSQNRTDPFWALPGQGQLVTPISKAMERSAHTPLEFPLPPSFSSTCFLYKHYFELQITLPPPFEGKHFRSVRCTFPKIDPSLFFPPYLLRGNSDRKHKPSSSSSFFPRPKTGAKHVVLSLLCRRLNQILSPHSTF